MAVARIAIAEAKLTATPPIREPKIEIVSPVHSRRKSPCRASKLVGGDWVRADLLLAWFMHATDSHLELPSPGNDRAYALLSRKGVERHIVSTRSDAWI
jgi:hypothetical protein